MDKLAVTIKPTFHSTRLLMTCGDDEVVKAILPAPPLAHLRAAPTLLEGLSLWYGQKLSVVLCADAKESEYGLSLCDGLGFGQKTLHYQVELVDPSAKQKGGKRLAGTSGCY